MTSIAGLLQYLQVVKAFDLFNEMKEKGLPGEITVNSFPVDLDYFNTSLNQDQDSKLKFLTNKSFIQVIS